MYGSAGCRIVLERWRHETADIAGGGLWPASVAEHEPALDNSLPGFANISNRRLEKPAGSVANERAAALANDSNSPVADPEVSG